MLSNHTTSAQLSSVTTAQLSDHLPSTKILAGLLSKEKIQKKIVTPTLILWYMYILKSQPKWYARQNEIKSPVCLCGHDNETWIFR